MKKTLSYFIVFAFLFSSVFTTGCFDSKNKIFSTRTLGALGLVIAVTATGGSTLPFAANVRGSISVEKDNVKIVGYAYDNGEKGEILFEGTPVASTSKELSFETAAEDEAKLAAHEYYLIEVKANDYALMSAIYHRGAKKLDSRDVEVNFETTAIRHAFDHRSDKTMDFIQFSNNVDATSITTFAGKIDTNLKAWDGTKDVEIDDSDATAALTSLGSDKYYRVYCDAIPGTEKDGDFEFVDLSKYFQIEAIRKELPPINIRGGSAPVPTITISTFPIYSDATFDFYLKEGNYTFKIAPIDPAETKDIFDKDVTKTKESKEITIDEDRKLTREDF